MTIAVNWVVKHKINQSNTKKLKVVPMNVKCSKTNEEAILVHLQRHSGDKMSVKHSNAITRAVA